MTKPRLWLSSPIERDLLAYLGHDGVGYALRKHCIERYECDPLLGRGYQYVGVEEDAPPKVLEHWRRLGGVEAVTPRKSLKVVKPRVLVGCEFSGVVRRAFRERGFDAWSCDILPAEDGSPYHIQGDVLEVLDDNWQLGIFHPPCTYLCNSGVCWLHKREGRWELMREGAGFFKRLLNASIPHIAIENPIMHKYAKEIIGVNQSQTIQPWMFGHGETKATCLWLKGLPLLKPTNVVEGRVQRLHFLPPSPDRAKERSRTYQGIADAFAEQWSRIFELPKQLSLFADAA